MRVENTGPRDSVRAAVTSVTWTMGEWLGGMEGATGEISGTGKLSLSGCSPAEGRTLSGLDPRDTVL